MPHASSKEVKTGDWLAGGGEMGGLIRSFDWSQTPLGPLENWPQSLRLAVNLCLNAPVPLLLWWEAEQFQFYNDACRSLLGPARRSLALGQSGPELWEEDWERLRPGLEAVLQGGGSGEFRERRLLLDGTGEPAYFTFACSPLRDETGQIRGVWTTVTASPLPVWAGQPAEASPEDGPGAVLEVNPGFTRLEEAEPALRTTHARNMDILNNIADGFFILDRNWRFVYVNNSGTALARQPREALLGQNVWEVFADMVDSDLQWQWRRAMEEQRPVSFEYYYDTYQDWVIFRVYPSLEGIAIFATNITEQKRAEEALRLSEERFAKAFQASPDTLAISRQADGYIIEVNESWQKLFGFSREEAVGHTPLELGLYVHPEDRPRLISLLQSQGFIRDLELEVQTRWGEIHYMSCSMEPIMIGEEPCMIAIMRDITEQKQAERDLQVSEREFRAMFELAGSGKIQVDPITSRFLRVNQRYCELTGYSQEELLNKLTAAEVTHPDDREREHELVWPVRQGLRDHWQLEKRYLRKDGQILWALVTGSLIRDEAGRPLHTIATVQDITDRREAEAALRRAHAELEQRVAERTAELERSLEELNKFTYVASHDLKAPLRGVKQLAGWITEDAGHLLPATSQTHLTKLQGRIERMEKFLDDLLLYSRLERHYYQAEEQVDSRVLLQEIIEVLAPPPGFTLTLQEPLPVLVTYRMPLELTFKNLIENALKHHDRAEGRIVISARETDSLVEFSVADDGPGIDPAFHSRIFQIFQTLHPRDERESTGAGLAIVQKAVEGQGGTITVISVPGQGATFRFTWPKKQNLEEL